MSPGPESLPSRYRPSAAEAAQAAVAGVSTPAGVSELPWTDQDEVQEAPRRRARIIRGDQVRLVRKKSLWENRIPLGEISIISGLGGLGKSTVAIDLAAAITQGKLPGHLHGTPRNVLIVATEDDLEGTLAPRAIACGADMERVHFLQMEDADGKADQMKLTVDRDELERVVVEQDIALVVLDPITALMSGLKINDEGDVRSVMTPLAELAHRTDCSFILIMHFNKSKGASADLRTIGSVAFNNAARANLSVARLPEAQDGGYDCMIAVVKTNVGELGQALSFAIEVRQVGDCEEGPIKGTKVRWGTASEMKIEDIMALAEENAINRDVATDCADWLKHFLTDRGGHAEYAEIKKAGMTAGGFTDYALRSAKKKLGLQARQFGMPKKSLWGFPDGLDRKSVV